MSYALPPKGWCLQLLSRTGTVAATSDLLSLSLEVVLSEAGPFEVHLPRNAPIVRDLAIGRRWKLLRGGGVFAVGIVTDVVHTPASVRLLGTTAEGVLSSLYRPQDAFPVGLSTSATSYTVTLDQYIEDSLYPVIVHGFGGGRWSECTISGGTITDGWYVQQNSSSTSLVIETPWLDLEESGCLLDHMAVLVTYSPPPSAGEIKMEYATSASPGTPSWQNLPQWNVPQYLSAYGETRRGQYRYGWSSPRPTLLRYLKGRFTLRSLDGSYPLARVTKLHLAVRSSTPMLDKGTPWPDASRNINYRETLRKHTARSLGDWLANYMNRAQYDIEVTTDWQLRVYDKRRGEWRGRDQRQNVVLVWGDTALADEWAESRLARLANNATVVGYAVTAADETLRRPGIETVNVATLPRSGQFSEYGVWNATLVADQAETASATDQASDTTSGNADDAWEVTMTVVPPRLAEDLAPGDLVDLIAPDIADRLLARVRAVGVELSPDGEVWRVKLVMLGRGPGGGRPVTPDPERVKKTRPLPGGLAQPILVVRKEV